MPLASVDGRKIYHEIHGDAAGTPLVLIQGMGGSCKGWLALQVPEFAPTLRTVIFDHRGVGESDDVGAPFAIADLADDISRLLDALEIERAHLLGAFMGGMVAQEFALREADRLERMVLVGTYARPDAKRRILLEKWREMARADTPAEVFLRERLLWTLQDETLDQDDLIEAMSESFPGDAPPISRELLMRQCDACLAHDTTGRLGEIVHPTLVICGRQDQLTPPRLHRELAAGIPNARLVIFEYAAHLVLAEAAERFNHAVLQFLTGDA